VLAYRYAPAWSRLFPAQGAWPVASAGATADGPVSGSPPVPSGDGATCEIRPVSLLELSRPGLASAAAPGDRNRSYTISQSKRYCR
jgi:hypothetical protein